MKISQEALVGDLEGTLGAQEQAPEDSMFCCKRCGKRGNGGQARRLHLEKKEDTQKRRGSLDMDADEDLGGHVATTRLLCHNMTGSKRGLRDEPKSATKVQKTEIQHLCRATGSSEQELWNKP